MILTYLRESEGFMDHRDRADNDPLIVTVLTPGTILVLTSGKYSDRSIDAVIRVIRAFHYASTLRSWLDSILAPYSFPDDGSRPTWLRPQDDLKYQRILALRGAIARLADLDASTPEDKKAATDYGHKIRVRTAEMADLQVQIRPEGFYQQATVENFVKHLEAEGLAKEIDVYEFNWDTD